MDEFQKDLNRKIDFQCKQMLLCIPGPGLIELNVNLMETKNLQSRERYGYGNAQEQQNRQKIKCLK